MLLCPMTYGDHYLTVNDLLSEIKSFLEEQDSKLFGKSSICKNLNKKFKKQLQSAKNNITEDNFKKQMAVLLIQTKKCLKETQVYYQRLYANNLWYQVPQPIRGCIGVLTGAFIFPVVVAQLFPLSISFKELFFSPSPGMEVVEKCKALNKALSHYFQTIIKTYKKTEKLPSFDNLTWDSEQLRKKEWAYAKNHLIKDGQLCAEGEQLSKKDHPELTHSFIVLGGRIFSLEASVTHFMLNSSNKDTINVKLAEDEFGGIWALKSPVGTQSAFLN